MSRLKPLKIKISELEKFCDEEYILFARCGISKRELRINCYGQFEVWDKNGLVYKDEYMEAAVQIFNNIE